MESSMRCSRVEPEVLQANNRTSNQRFSVEESKEEESKSELFMIVCLEPQINQSIRANPQDTLDQIRGILRDKIEFNYEFLAEIEEGEFSEVATEEEREIKLSAISTEKSLKIRKIHLLSLFE